MIGTTPRTKGEGGSDRTHALCFSNEKINTGGGCSSSEPRTPLTHGAMSHETHPCPISRGAWPGCPACPAGTVDSRECAWSLAEAPPTVSNRYPGKESQTVSDIKDHNDTNSPGMSDRGPAPASAPPRTSPRAFCPVF